MYEGHDTFGSALQQLTDARSEGREHRLPFDPNNEIIELTDSDDNAQ